VSPPAAPLSARDSGPGLRGETPMQTIDRLSRTVDAVTAHGAAEVQLLKTQLSE